jgi:hypothetical protein
MTTDFGKRLKGAPTVGAEMPGKVARLVALNARGEALLEEVADLVALRWAPLAGKL